MHIRTLSDVEAAYIAGIIDGEGTITLTRTKGGFRAPIVSISSNDLELLEWVKETIGGGWILIKPPRRATHKIGYAWCIKSRNAVLLCAMIKPYLRIASKYRRADLLTDRYLSVTKRNGNYSDAERESKVDFEAEFFA
jgi:hypothetical protein